MIAYVSKSDEFSYLRNDVNLEKSTCPQNKSGIQDYSIGIQIEEEINQQKNLTLIKTKKRHLLSEMPFLLLLNQINLYHHGQAYLFRLRRVCRPESCTFYEDTWVQFQACDN